LWSGTITFGMVSIPVELFAAVRSADASLRMLDGKGRPLRRVYVCPRHGEPLEPDEIVRGYPTAPDEFVLVEDDELESLAPEKSRDIELEKFVDRVQIDPVYFDRSYFLVPSGGSTKPYRLLTSTMEATDRAGIASFVMRGKQYLVAILSEDGILRAQTLRYHDEVRSLEDVGLQPPTKASKDLVATMVDAIDAIAEDELDRDELVDDDTARLHALVEEKKSAGEGIVEAPRSARESGTKAMVVDLMEVLKERLGGPGGADAELSEKSKSELYERAKELDIEGRSHMSKKELIDAIRKSA
jgi:DNA end-binding protein Ku